MSHLWEDNLNQRKFALAWIYFLTLNMTCIIDCILKMEKNPTTCFWRCKIIVYNKNYEIWQKGSHFMGEKHDVNAIFSKIEAHTNFTFKSFISQIVLSINLEFDDK